MKKWLFVVLAACPIWAQVPKKQLTEADYILWSTLEQEQLSDDGRWACYTLTYESGTDTLFVKNTKTAKLYSFAGGTEGRFAADSHFVFHGGDGVAVLVNLTSGSKMQYPNISHYSLALGGRLLVLLENAGATAGDLLVVAMDGKVLKRIPKATLFSLNPAGDQLVCDYEGQLLLLDLNRLDHPQLIDSKRQKYHAAVWQANGASLAYLTEGQEAYVGFYHLADKKHHIFDRAQFEAFPKEAELYDASVTELMVSDDGRRVFFGVKPKEPPTDNKGVQVWNTSDKVLYPRRIDLKGWTGVPKLAVWFPEQQSFRMVTDIRFPHQQLLPGQEFALVYNPIENEPQFDRDAPVDYYLQDIATGEQKRVLENQSTDVSMMGISNMGYYIAYFKEKQWWVYNIKAGTHRNLTSRTGHSFTDEKYDRSGEGRVRGIAGWTTHDNELLVYDSYDIWLLNTDGSGAERLTRGRENGIVYRVASVGVVDLKQGVLLKAVSETKSGYFTLDNKKGLQKIVFELNRIGGIIRSSNGVYVYIREHYHLPPEVVVQFASAKAKVLYQSNPQQQNYQWGFSKLISFENSKGQLLNGALFYPAGYDPDKSYPMVVYIYERQSDAYKEYVNPSLLNQDGFNISNLTTQGYFVLLPDIAYKEGVTGQSAVDCVTSAVAEVLAHEPVDRKRVGLIGHSFGGYETSFIVTQTNLFAATISGAGFNDFVSSYLSVGLSNMRQDCWRYESSQLRMGTPLFDQFNQYLQNSPITFAAQVQTPFLLWAGTNDGSIDYRQSLEFHLALRRLGKPNILLLYEGGGHALMKREYQVDLAHRMIQWWDYYLKDEKKPDWFTPDQL